MSKEVRPKVAPPPVTNLVPGVVYPFDAMEGSAQFDIYAKYMGEAEDHWMIEASGDGMQDSVTLLAKTSYAPRKWYADEQPPK